MTITSTSRWTRDRRGKPPLAESGRPGGDQVQPGKRPSGLASIAFAPVFLFFSLASIEVFAAERDVYVSGLVLYAKLAPNSVEAKEHGTYPRLSRYDRHGGLAPDKIDVVGVVNGRDVEVRVVLEIFPIVGLTNWQETEGITDSQLLESSKTMFPSALRLEKTVRLRGRTDVKYADIDLSPADYDLERQGLLAGGIPVQAVRGTSCGRDLAGQQRDGIPTGGPAYGLIAGSFPPAPEGTRGR